MSDPTMVDILDNGLECPQVSLLAGSEALRRPLRIALAEAAWLPAGSDSTVPLPDYGFSPLGTTLVVETLETLFTVRQESHDPYVAGCVAAARPYRGLATLDATEGRVQGQTILGILWLSYQDVPWILRFCKAKVRHCLLCQGSDDKTGAQDNTLTADMDLMWVTDGSSSEGATVRSRRLSASPSHRFLVAFSVPRPPQWAQGRSEALRLGTDDAREAWATSLQSVHFIQAMGEVSQNRDRPCSRTTRQLCCRGHNSKHESAQLAAPPLGMW
eukprot:s1433_g14.t1